MPENNVDKKGAAVRFPPPVIGILTIIAGYLLGHQVPLFAQYSLATPDRYWSGGAIIVVAGLVLALWPIWLFRNTKQSITAWSATPEIIVTGPYKFTRNPMYLMMMLSNLGFAIILSEAWILIFMPVLALSVYHIAIKHEEAYLEKKFGESYLAYKNSVRRWL